MSLTLNTVINPINNERIFIKEWNLNQKKVLLYWTPQCKFQAELIFPSQRFSISESSIEGIKEAKKINNLAIIFHFFSHTHIKLSHDISDLSSWKIYISQSGQGGVLDDLFSAIFMKEKKGSKKEQLMQNFAQKSREFEDTLTSFQKTISLSQESENLLIKQLEHLTAAYKHFHGLIFEKLESFNANESQFDKKCELLLQLIQCFKDFLKNQHSQTITSLNYEAAQFEEIIGIQKKEFMMVLSEISKLQKKKNFLDDFETLRDLPEKEKDYSIRFLIRKYIRTEDGESLDNLEKHLGEELFYPQLIYISLEKGHYGKAKEFSRIRSLPKLSGHSYFHEFTKTKEENISCFVCGERSVVPLSTPYFELTTSIQKEDHCIAFEIPNFSRIVTPILCIDFKDACFHSAQVFLDGNELSIEPDDKLFRESLLINLNDLLIDKTKPTHLVKILSTDFFSKKLEIKITIQSKCPIKEI